MSKPVIKFGTYDNEPLEWYVLKEEGFKKLIFYKDILFSNGEPVYIPFSENNSSNWADSDIRKWLNKDFWKTFTDDEKKKIVNVQLTDVNNTKDNIFLLSKTEAETLTTSVERCVGNRYWLRTSYNSCDVYTYYDLYYSTRNASNSYYIRPAM